MPLNYQDITDANWRKKELDKIFSEDNKDRKRIFEKRLDVYEGRQKKWIEEKLLAEFDTKTVQKMRTITSINLAPRIVDEQASLYLEEPKREFYSSESKIMQDNVIDQIDKIYELAKTNTKLKKANKYFKALNQCAVKVTPNKVTGKIEMKVLSPHIYDVVTLDADPTIPYCYIILTHLDPTTDTDKWPEEQEKYAKNQNPYRSYLDKHQDRSKMRFTWWSSEYNMITDGLGNIIQKDPNDIANPVGMIPIIDISNDKEFDFWVKEGSNITDFAIDFGALVSDTANTNRLQSYSQAIIYAHERPASIDVGPQKVLWIQQDPDPDRKDPKFEFVTPSPDMQASLELLDRSLNYFLTSEGLSAGMITGQATAKQYSSGFERLLAMIEKFEASRDDIDAFKSVENKIYELFKAWTNFYSTATNSPLSDEYKISKIPDDSYLSIEFVLPTSVQSKSEKIDNSLKMLDAGLKSKVQALMEIEGLEEDEAINKLKKMSEHSAETGPELMVRMQNDEEE